MLQMLRLLRSSLPEDARLSAAVQDVPFAGPDGKPLSDVSDFAGVLDWVNIMNYDVFGCALLLSLFLPFFDPRLLFFLILHFTEKLNTLFIVLIDSFIQPGS